MRRGAVYVVYGDRAEYLCNRAVDALHDSNPRLPVHVMRARRDGLSDMQCSRWAKVTLLDWTPYEHTVYLDADTVVFRDLSAGFAVLDSGFELAIVPSDNQSEDDWLWHIDERERDYTRDVLPFQPLQLQAGVFFVANTPRTRQLWEVWREEWERYTGQDQGALLRALHQSPVAVWLLGKPYNNGCMIKHDWGAIGR